MKSTEMDAAAGIARACTPDGPTYRALDPREVRLDADRLYGAGELSAAEGLYEQLLAIDRDSNWCLFQLGRIAAQGGRWEDAINRFDRALACADPVVWAHFEKALALEQLGATARTVASELASFAGQAPDELADGHYAVLLQGAHTAFDAGSHEDAYLLYDLLVRRGQGGYVCKLRRADLHLLRGDAEETLRGLDELAADPEYDFWGKVTRARAYLALGEHDAAADLLKPVVASAPGNLDFIRLLFSALEGVDDRKQLAAPDVFLRGLSRDQRFEFLLRARLRCEDYEGVARLYAEFPVAVTSAGAQLVAATVNALIARSDFDAIDRLAEAIGVVATRSPSIISAFLSALFVQQDWERAGQLLEAASGVLSQTGDPQLRVQKLQFLCFTMQLQRAQGLVAEWGMPSELPGIASAAAASLYAALGQWPKVLDLFRDRVDQGFSIEDDVFLDTIARATRRTRAYSEVIGLLNRTLERCPTEAVANFRDRLMAEVALLRSLGLHEPVADPPIATPLFAHRTTLLANALSTCERRNHIGGAIYFCTDLNYLVGTSVAAFSLLRNNPGVGRRRSLTVVCSGDALAPTAGIFEEIAAAFSVSIRVWPSATLFGSDHPLQTRYGFFTPGHALTRAAYYRIFTVRRLYDEGDRGRAVYLDSDTVIGPGVDELFEFDLQGDPLGARLELDRPEIRRAASKLGLDPARYFNSGVLVLDLSHPALPEALDRAIDIALHKSEILFFQDQCALNLAFGGRAAVLPEKFNYFIRPDDEPEVVAPEPIVGHFLDRPKPWDPMYRSANCMRWVREFAALRQILSGDRLRELLAIQFTRAQEQAAG